MNNFDSIADYIKKTPKTELHLHIEGSLEPELMFKLSKRNKIEIPFKTVEEVKSAYNFSNLIDYPSSKLCLSKKITYSSLKTYYIYNNFAITSSHK